MGDRLKILLGNIVFYIAAGLLGVGFGPVVALALVGVVTWEYVARNYLAGMAFLLERICGTTVQVTGLENIPQGQVLFASAQQCTWENLYFPQMFGNPVIFMKNEMVRYPIVGSLARERGYITANRGQGIESIRQTFLEAMARKAEGRSFFIFPTGWRTGKQLSPPLQHGIAKIYSSLDLPCVPIAHNAELCWPHGSWLRLPGCIRVHVLPPIEPGLEKGEFLTRLHAELFGATDDLLSPPLPPKSYRRLDTTGQDLVQSFADGPT